MDNYHLAFAAATVSVCITLSAHTATINASMNLVAFVNACQALQARVGVYFCLYYHMVHGTFGITLTQMRLRSQHQVIISMMRMLWTFSYQCNTRHQTKK